MKGRIMHRNIKVLIVLFTMILLVFTFLSHKTVAAEQTSLNVVNPLTGDQWFNFNHAAKECGRHIHHKHNRR